MPDFPPSIAAINHVAPAPRRVRGILDNKPVFDTTRALYVWEWPHYPQYYIPRADVRTDGLRPQGAAHATPGGKVQRYALYGGAPERHRFARLILESGVEPLRDHFRFEWDALDAWFEEDEEIFVHPRNPYSRVDALRSTRTVRIELEGVVLAESCAPVMVFETGLPTRYYVDRGDVNFECLAPSGTRRECPYKGRTTGYWSVIVNGRTHRDLAWMYSFPTRQLLPIVGLVAFLNEKVDISIDGLDVPRPVTHLGD